MNCLLTYSEYWLLRCTKCELQINWHESTLYQYIKLPENMLQNVMPYKVTAMPNRKIKLSSIFFCVILYKGRWRVKQSIIHLMLYSLINGSIIDYVMTIWYLSKNQLFLFHIMEKIQKTTYNIGKIHLDAWNLKLFFVSKLQSTLKQ